MTMGLRIDKWLWFARFAKSRSLAQRIVESGAVTLNGRVLQKSSAEVQPGDEVALTSGRWIRCFRVMALGERRGPAPEAHRLYIEISGTPADG